MLCPKLELLAWGQFQIIHFCFTTKRNLHAQKEYNEDPMPWFPPETLPPWNILDHRLHAVCRNILNFEILKKV